MKKPNTPTGHTATDIKGRIKSRFNSYPCRKRVIHQFPKDEVFKEIFEQAENFKKYSD